MIFRQLTHDDLGCASYLVGDDRAGLAAVVDPRFEIDEYLELARYLGVRIEHVFETHTHADHLSGHGRLAAATGATIHIHAEAAAQYPHEPLADGDELALGRVLIRAIHTPGHRPEHTSFALIDTARSEEPWAVLSGDSLFVGDIARPDLAVEKEDGARAIYHSLHEKLLTLPDTVELWPAHLGGSMCGGPGMDLKTSSTIGYERRFSPMLAIDDEDAFVERSLAALGPQPPNFRAIVELNRGPLITGGTDLLALSPGQVEQQKRAGALLVDVRTDVQFDDAHIPGAISISMLGAGFGSKLAWLADPGRELVFIGRDDADGRHAAKLATAIGLHHFAGFLGGGMTTWRQDRRPIGRTERLPISELVARWASDGLQVLDVRARSEWDAGHLPGSVFRPWHDIHGVPETLDPERPIAVVCASGQRAATAASLLQAAGAARVIHVVDGGVATLGRAGERLETSADGVAPA
jgi:hydroxyacylglutathione hydrolase